MPGRNFNFSDEDMQVHLHEQMSGLPAEKRPGHLTPDPLTERERAAIAGIEALRHPLADNIPHT